jgi:hypothetical protein
MWTGLGKIGSLMANALRRRQSPVTAPGDHLAGNGADAIPLRRRMSSLGIDADKFAHIEPALFGDLQTLCAGCGHPRLCKYDLRHDPAGVAWEDYCPNAVMLNAITALRWFRDGHPRATQL